MVVHIYGDTKEIRFIDLFGGIGGFRKGIEQSKLNANCVAYYDIDKYATAVYNYNFKENHKPSDITKVKSKDIPDFDLLCGGFPCQPFSVAGDRRGFEDTRGTLFFEIARIAEYHRPPLLFLENVKGILSHENGRTMKVICETLNNLGYIINIEVYNSKDFGVPQNRERVFFLCTHITAIINDGQRKKIVSSERIIQDYLCQLLPNNSEEAIKLQEHESKDCILGLFLLKEINNGLSKKFRFSERTRTRLSRICVGLFNVDMEQSTINQDISELREKLKKDTILTLLEEKSSTLETELVWQNIDMLLKSIWEENYLGWNKYTISTATKQIIDWKTYTLFQMQLSMLTLTVQLRSSSKNSWNEILCNLTLIQEGMNYARISQATETAIISESGTLYDTAILEGIEKAFIIGHLGEGSAKQIFPIGESDNETDELQRQIGSTITARYGGATSNGDFIVNKVEASIIQLNNPNHSNNRVYGENGISPSLNTMQGGNRQPKIALNTKIRRLTPIECERLQGYPDNWTKYGMIDGKVAEMSDTQRYKMCGNSVTVNVIQAIAEKIRNCDFYGSKNA